MGKQENDKRRSEIRKKEDGTLTIIDCVFKNKKIAVELLEVKNGQRLYRKYEDNGEDDRRIDDFINRTFKGSPEFEIKAYRKALYLIAEYESDIWYSFSKKEYKDKEKWFVDTLYNCSPEDLVISFPDLGAKEKKLKELKCRYEQERDLTVKRWIKIITFYCLVDEKAVSKKRYSEFLSKILEMPQLEAFGEFCFSRLEKSIGVKGLNWQDVKNYNYIFINSLMDFRSIEFNIPAELYDDLSESKEEFDYILKTNENDGLVDNETIGILKNCSISEAAKIFVGDMLFVKIKNDNGLLVKKITYAKLNDQLHFIFEPFRNIIYGSIDDVNYDFLGVLSLEGDNNDGSENIIPNSFRLIDRSRCKIKTKIDEISKSIKTVYKAELVLDLEIDSSSVLLNIPLDIIEAEAFNSHYVAGIHLGNKQAFIADNKGGGVFKIEDDTSDM